MNLDTNTIFQNSLRMKQIDAELKTLSAFERNQVRLLATETLHTWESAIAAVKAGDYRVRATEQRAMPRHLASINLPPPIVPRGQRTTRRQRRKG